MIRNIGVHGADDAAIVDHTGEIGKRFADFDAALAMALEFERGRHEAGAAALLVKLAAGLLAFVFFEGGFGIERIDVGGAAVEEKENGALGARPNHGVARRFLRGEHLRSERAREAKHAEAGAHAVEHLATRKDAAVGGGVYARVSRHT